MLKNLCDTVSTSPRGEGVKGFCDDNTRVAKTNVTTGEGGHYCVKLFMDEPYSRSVLWQAELCCQVRF